MRDWVVWGTRFCEFTRGGRKPKALGEKDARSMINHIRKNHCSSSAEIGKNFRQIRVWRETTEAINKGCLRFKFKSERVGILDWSYDIQC